MEPLFKLSKRKYTNYFTVNLKNIIHIALRDSYLKQKYDHNYKKIVKILDKEYDKDMGYYDMIELYRQKYLNLQKDGDKKIFRDKFYKDVIKDLFSATSTWSDNLTNHNIKRQHKNARCLNCGFIIESKKKYTSPNVSEIPDAINVARYVVLIREFLQNTEIEEFELKSKYKTWYSLKIE